jgi:hypothetical protein
MHVSMNVRFANTTLKRPRPSHSGPLVILKAALSIVDLAFRNSASNVG